MEVKGRNRKRLFEYLNTLSNKELAKVLNPDCKSCPFKLDCDEEHWGVTCENLIEQVLDKDEYLGEIK